MLRNHSAVVLALVTVALAACSRKPEPAQPTPTTNAETPPPATQPPPPTTPATDPNADAARETARLRGVLEDLVFFDYDQSAIRDDARGTLDQKVVILRANPNVTIRIEGHADERGSVEYNLALSLRRANSIKNYLTGFGLDASRFEVAALGEEQPLESGTSEQAYARNRRGEFIITRGGETLVAR